MSDRLTTLEIVHAADGRVRLRPSKPLDASALTGLADLIAGLPKVQRVLARPATGSLIIETDGPAQPLFDLIAAQGIAKVRPKPSPPPLGQVARFGLMRADAAVQGATDGALDLNGAMAFLLMGGAVVQLLRGQVAGPATTLAVAALAMLDRPGGNRS
jgi:hypothetical protein